MRDAGIALGQRRYVPMQLKVCPFAYLCRYLKYIHVCMYVDEQLWHFYALLYVRSTSCTRARTQGRKGIFPYLLSI